MRGWNDAQATLLTIAVISLLALGAYQLVEISIWIVSNVRIVVAP